LNEEALDRTLWRTRFGRGYGPVVIQTKEWMNDTDFKVLHTFLQEGLLKLIKHYTNATVFVFIIIMASLNSLTVTLTHTHLNPFKISTVMRISTR
jgi:hypothetical protein